MIALADTHIQLAVTPAATAVLAEMEQLLHVAVEMKCVSRNDVHQMNRLMENFLREMGVEQSPFHYVFDPNLHDNHTQVSLKSARIYLRFALRQIKNAQYQMAAANLNCFLIWFAGPNSILENIFEGGDCAIFVAGGRSKEFDRRIETSYRAFCQYRDA